MPAYSFLNENTCPCSAALAAPATPVTFEKLTFWTLGYGGWLGVAMLPILWSIPVSKTVRAALSVLMLPLSALTLTAVFACFYVTSLFTYHMASVMISPQFLHSCIGIVCISIASLAFWIGSSKRLDIRVQMEYEAKKDEEDGEETVGNEEDGDETVGNEEDGEETVGNEEDGDETVGSEENGEEDGEEDGEETEEETEEETVGSEEDGEASDDSHEETVGSDESDNSHTNSANDTTWRETANFEGLRTAAPLPE